MRRYRTIEWGCHSRKTESRGSSRKRLSPPARTSWGLFRPEQRAIHRVSARLSFRIVSLCESQKLTFQLKLTHQGRRLLARERLPKLKHRARKRHKARRSFRGRCRSRVTSRHALPSTACAGPTQHPFADQNVSSSVRKLMTKCVFSLSVSGLEGRDLLHEFCMPFPRRHGPAEHQTDIDIARLRAPLAVRIQQTSNRNSIFAEKCSRVICLR
jgi:hypothetical protein